ncbi:hypothetical protein Hdeb2414_s0022g00613281 [Helianthus debilis subsp. tardiflorus]
MFVLNHPRNSRDLRLVYVYKHLITDTHTKTHSCHKPSATTASPPPTTATLTYYHHIPSPRFLSTTTIPTIPQIKSHRLQAPPLPDRRRLHYYTTIKPATLDLADKHHQSKTPTPSPANPRWRACK